MPERDGDLFGAGLGAEAGRGEEGEPGLAMVGEAVAEEGADLFAALLEAGADECLGRRGEEERGGFADEVEEGGLDLGAGVEAGAGDAVAGGEVVGGLEEDGDGAELFAAGVGGVALGGLELEHEDEAGGEGAGEDLVHPRGGDGVGEVGDDFEVGGGEVGGEGGEGELKGVALDEVESVGVEGEEGF